MLIAHWPKESAPMQGALILFVTVAQFTAEVSGQEKPIQTETINSKKDEDTLRQLLLKRRIALKQHVAAVQAAFEDDAIQFSAVMTAQRLLLDAELELCNSPAERIAVHEKTVEIHKDIEKRIEALSRQGRRGGEADKQTFAIAARLEAEIALQRERMKANARPAGL